MSAKALEYAKGIRGLLEDILAPTVSRLEERVGALGERCERLASEIQENRGAHEALLRHLNEQLGSLNGRLSNLEGRTDGIKAELTLMLQVEMLKFLHGLPQSKGQGRGALLPPEESS